MDLGHLPYVRLLVEEGSAQLDARQPFNLTPLLCAARRGHLAVADYLLERGANPTLKSQEGFTALAYLRYWYGQRGSSFIFGTLFLLKATVCDGMFSDSQ